MVQHVKQTLLGILSFIIAFLLLESISRIGATIVDDYRALRTMHNQDWFELSPQLGWKNNEGFKGSLAGVYREFDNEKRLLSAPSSAGTHPKWKIAFIGDSNTFGFGVPRESTFVELLGNLKPDISAINLGVMGYTSYQGLQVVRSFRDSARPDLIVVSFNYNDRRFVVRREDVDGPAYFQRLGQGIQRA
jgi:hypothetical protein